ncbi:MULTISPECIES: tRNA (adenine(22)-N(1))-methyltransferase [Clostridia]|jgi:tRNA (adenine22-N1)-methyltransferase|uniref:tRNA (adenine(22)-N(1))-methyltransferase n=1 Tax=Clostridia TaxID=186801 RepID=UPI000E542720|nr:MULTISPECIES: class I SAM-dependent methyltransferase [Clostridia]RHV64341.1 SAM-dependent methyltransferase [Roseburia sp. OM02-15]
MAIHLSKRLTALANMVTDGNRLADIGTDHGYIPIYLCQTGKIPSALAMDIGKGPLQQAQTHIAEHGLSEQIKTRLSDGMAALQFGEADTILIAGMGGGLVMKILSEGAEKLTGKEELILQPQSEIALVREFLRVRNFQILNEDMILEDGKYYPMMKVSQQKAAEQTKILPQEVADAFGPVLLQKRHPVLKEWLERELRTTNSVIEQLSAQPDHERIRNRMQQVNCKKTLILEALKNYGTESVQSDD